MSVDRALNLILGCVIVSMVMTGGTIELLGCVFLLGVIFGGMVGAAFVYGEREPLQ